MESDSSLAGSDAKVMTTTLRKILKMQVLLTFCLKMLEISPEVLLSGKFTQWVLAHLILIIEHKQQNPCEF